MKTMIIFFTLLPFLTSSFAWAEECWSIDKSFYDCSQWITASSSSASGGDSIQTNPAGLPVQPSPLGLEGIWSDPSSPSGKGKLDLSTIKGFEGIGFGIGSWTEDTFSAPNFRDHYRGTVWEQAYLDHLSNNTLGLGVRIGTAIGLPFRFLPKRIALSIGGSIGLGNVKYSSSKQLGIVARIYNFGIGYSQSYEQLSLTLPKPRIDIFTAGFFWGPIFLGYSNQTITSILGDTSSHTFSFHGQASKWSLYLARKEYVDYRGIAQNWDILKVSRRLGKHFATGYIYGYYPRSHSAVLQINL